MQNAIVSVECVQFFKKILAFVDLSLDDGTAPLLEHLRDGTSSNTAVLPFSVKRPTGPPTAMLISMYLNSNSRVYGGGSSSVSLALRVGGSDLALVAAFDNNLIR